MPRTAAGQREAAARIRNNCPVEIDHGGGIFSIDGIRFVRYGARQKFFLDKPTSIYVGCRDTNASRWENCYDDMSDRQKLVLPPGVKVCYRPKCGYCLGYQSVANENKKKKLGEKRKAAQEARAEGQHICVRCPDGMQSLFTPDKNGQYHSECDYHHAYVKGLRSAHWNFLESLIDPRTQALCKECTGVFLPSQMMQIFVNVVGQEIEQRRVRLCPPHYARSRANGRAYTAQHQKNLTTEMLHELDKLHATGKTGCYDDECELDHETLRTTLRSRHEIELGDTLYATSFDADHDPRPRSRITVGRISNPIRRAQERKKTKPRCACGCHPLKTWANFEYGPYIEGSRDGVKTRNLVRNLQVLKLRRFEGKDPSRLGQKGCQGYKNARGDLFDCPLQDYLEKMKVKFETTVRLGSSSEIDSKYGFLAMYVLDHDRREKKMLNYSNSSNFSFAKLVEEMDDSTLRCKCCDRFKTILCGDTKSVTWIAVDASIMSGSDDDLTDAAVLQTLEDDITALFGGV